MSNPVGRRRLNNPHPAASEPAGVSMWRAGSVEAWPRRHRMGIGGLRLALGVAVLVAVLAGCSKGDGPSAQRAGGESPAPMSGLSGNITVWAASSLRAPFVQLAGELMASNQGLTVNFNFDSSSTLATRLAEGGSADVFASADLASMKKLSDAELITGDAREFASNRMVIVTKPDNPNGIASVADLAKLEGAGVVSLCGADVTCGRYAKEVLKKAGVSIDETSVARGQNATATINAVAQGSAAAGIVYESDARAAAGSVEMVEIPARHNVVARYSIAALAGTDNHAAADAFVSYVLSEAGQELLRSSGFSASKSAS